MALLSLQDAFAGGASATCLRLEHFVGAHACRDGVVLVAFNLDRLEVRLRHVLLRQLMVVALHEHLLTVGLVVVDVLRRLLLVLVLEGRQHNLVLELLRGGCRALVLRARLHQQALVLLAATDAVR